MNSNTNPQYKKSTAIFFVAAFGIVILAISAVTTFSFFATYFTAIFPADMLGAELAGLLAGGAGVTLFDIATIYWLYTFLNHAETSEQRGIALLMLIVTFIGAAGASVAQLGLAASGDVALDPSTRQSIANAAVWTVIAGVVSNFGANIAYGRYSLASKQAVMEADRRDMVQNAEDEQARLLDGLIAQNVKELITAEAGALAQEQARRVVAAFRSREMSKYAGSGADGAAVYEIQDGNSGKWKTIRNASSLEEATRHIEGLPTGLYSVVLDGKEIYNTRRAQQPRQEPQAARPTQAPSMAQTSNGAGYHYPANGSDYRPE